MSLSLIYLYRKNEENLLNKLLRADYHGARMKGKRNKLIKENYLLSELQRQFNLNTL